MVGPNHPKVDHGGLAFSAESHGFADSTISKKTICICLSGFFMPVPGSTIAATTVAPQNCYSSGEEVKLRCNHLEVNRVEAPPLVRTGSCWVEYGVCTCLQYVWPDSSIYYISINTYIYANLLRPKTFKK